VLSDLREFGIDHRMAEQKPIVDERFYHDLPALLRLRPWKAQAAWVGLGYGRLAAAGSRLIINTIRCLK
jgi:hypothetical protein